MKKSLTIPKDGQETTHSNSILRPPVFAPMTPQKPTPVNRRRCIQDYGQESIAKKSGDMTVKSSWMEERNTCRNLSQKMTTDRSRP